MKISYLSFLFLIVFLLVSQVAVDSKSKTQREIPITKNRVTTLNYLAEVKTFSTDQDLDLSPLE